MATSNNNEPAPNETQVMSLADLQAESKKLEGYYFTLTVIEGSDFGTIFQIDKEEMLIGRKDVVEKDNEKQIDIAIEDNRASRNHALLQKKQRPNNELFYIKLTNLNSKNGTFVNNSRVIETDLHSGDKIQIGNTVLKFEVKDRLETAFHERVFQQATKDPLTNLWNRNYINQEIEKAIVLGQRHNWPFSLLFVEIDFFQTLKETNGQNAADTVLSGVAQTIKSQVNEYDVVARYGDWQFLILLPEANIRAAKTSAEQLRQAVSEIDFSSINYNQRITTSTGISQFPINGKDTSTLITQADEALYQAKQMGRNRVCLAESQLETTTTTYSKARKALVTFFILILAIAAAFGAYTFYPTFFASKSNELVFSGVVEIQEVNIGSKVGGRVSEVLVKPGQRVKAGDILVKFDVSELLAKKSLHDARIVEAQAKLKKLENGYLLPEITEVEAATKREFAVLESLKNGPRKEEIEQLRSELQALTAELNSAKNSYKRIEEVYKSGNVSAQAHDDAKVAVDLAEFRVNALKQKLALLEAGTRPEDIRAAEERYKETKAKEQLIKMGSRSEDIASARANLEAMQAELLQLDIQIKEGTIVSPSDGKLQVVSVRPGDLVLSNKPVIKLLEDTQMWIRIYVPEPLLGKVFVGQTANINIDTFPSGNFPGYVEEISSEGEFTPRNIQTRRERDNLFFGIKVRTNNKDGIFKSGMSAEVKLDSKNTT